MKTNTEKFNPTTMQNLVFDRSGKLGVDACNILAEALNAVNPYSCVKEVLDFDGDQLRIANNYLDINEIDRIYVLGFGKAAVPMAKAVLDIVDQKIEFASLVTKDPKFLSENRYLNKLQVFIGGHPLPSQDSVNSTINILKEIPKLSKNDLVLVLISGGGSALFTQPVDEVELDDIIKLTDLLLKSGADINEINTLRKHLDQVKGGKLLAHLQPAIVHTLILSDVVGDYLDVIASGPTVPDPTTFNDSLDIIKKYKLMKEIPVSIRNNLDSGNLGLQPETLKSLDLISFQVFNHIIGANVKALEAAKERAVSLGYNTLILSTFLTGLTKDVASFISGIIQTEMAFNYPAEKPACLILGGETTVEVKGDGLGGRNQDLVLRMVEQLSHYKNLLMVSLATDGDDGPTDAAGAAADPLVFHEGMTKWGLDIDTYIKSNDAYHYLDKCGALIKTGSTATNVNDLVLILIGE